MTFEFARRPDGIGEGALERILFPRSVAFVGASASPVKAGGRRWLSMVSSGFQGSLYPIHPHASEVAGIPALRSVRDVPEPLDLVVVAIRPDRVEEVVEACAAREVGGVVVITGGFGEHSEIGKSVERSMMRHLDAVGARLIGPNCAGIYSSAGSVNVTGMEIPPGPIGLVTQSGNVLLDVAHRARRSGIGLSHAISMGNAVDLRAPELLEALLRDPATKVVLVYLEGWRPGEARRFCDIVRESDGRKPVIILKPGDTEAGRRAVMSHTGSLAGEVEVARGAFDQAGIIQASSLDEAWMLAQALATAPPLTSRGIAVASDGGGHATLACDALEAAGLTVPILSEDLRQALLRILPERCPVANPVDYAGFAEEEPAVVAESLDLCLADDAVGGALLAGHFGGYHRLAGEAVAEAERQAGERIGRIMQARAKPIVIHSVYADDLEPTIRILRGHGVPVVRSLPDAAALMRGLGLWHRFSSRPRHGADSGSAPPAATAEILARVEGRSLLEPDARRLLSAYGLPMPPFQLATSADECVAAVAAFTGPVAMKVVSAAIVHKSDVGGVILNVGPDGARDAFGRLAGIAAAAGDADASVLVTAMARPGLELALGAVRDPHFGPVVMLGLGGVFVDIIDDVVFRMAPLTRSTAHEMIGALRAAKVLDGYRGAASVDRDRLAMIMVQLSNVIAAEATISEIDINPLIAAGSSFDIVDARIIVV